MKNEDAKQRIRTIRTKVREERELISKLNRVAADQNLKRLLRPTSRSLDHVENLFLNEKALQERTPAALARRLHEAEKVLRRVTQQRKSFELIIRKFGATARLISG